MVNSAWVAANPVTTRELKLKPRHSGWWLGIGVALLLGCVYVWFAHKNQPVVQNQHVEANPATNAAETEANNPLKMLEGFSSSLGFMEDAVPPLDLTKAIPHTDQHAPEFRGPSFLTAEASKITLQIMNVSQESVIIDYLAKRKDRSQFNYFRYVDAAKQERYILTYGAFDSMEGAVSALQKVNFDLPGSVRAFAERYANYLPFSAKNTDADEHVTDLGANRPRTVRLKPVPVPAGDVAQLEVRKNSHPVRERHAAQNSDSDESQPIKPKHHASKTTAKSHALNDDFQTHAEPPIAAKERAELADQAGSEPEAPSAAAESVSDPFN